MKVYKKYITVKTSKRIDFLNITEQVRRAVRESGVEDGIVLVNPMHITASVFVNDNESGLLSDFKAWLEKLAPMNLDDLKKYKHNLTGEDNAYAHLWRTIMGRESIIAISDFELDLGPWEAIFYGEFDGQREKRILIKVLGQ
jgi:secondary thiamine-phosphate synthase enzyme